MAWWGWLLVGLLVALGVVVVYDLTQRRHAILRNFPIIGHFRYLLEGVGPELRQYIVTGNDEERPFSRDQRRWVYASSKKREQLLRLRHRQRPRALAGYLIIKQAPFPLADAARRASPASTRTTACRARRCSAARAGARRRSGRPRSSTSRR